MTLKEQLIETVSQCSDTPDKEFLAESLDAFIRDALPKFLSGYKEHKGSIIERPLIKDLKQEIIDSNFYVRALEVKRDRICEKLQTFYSNNTHVTGRPYSEIRDIVTELRNL